MPITYNPSQLGELLRQWGSGNLDNITDRGHALAGVEGVVMSGAGLVAMGLCQRYTQADVDQALELMLRGGDADHALFLISIHMLGWTIERLARAMDWPTVSYGTTVVMDSEDAFSEALINAV